MIVASFKERNYPFIRKPGSPSLMRGGAAEAKDEGRIRQHYSPSHKAVRPPGIVKDGQGLAIGWLVSIQLQPMTAGLNSLSKCGGVLADSCAVGDQLTPIDVRSLVSKTVVTLSGGTR